MLFYDIIFFTKGQFLSLLPHTYLLRIGGKEVIKMSKESIKSAIKVLIALLNLIVLCLQGTKPSLKEVAFLQGLPLCLYYLRFFNFCQPFSQLQEQQMFLRQGPCLTSTRLFCLRQLILMLLKHRLHLILLQLVLSSTNLRMTMQLCL